MGVESRGTQFYVRLFALEIAHGLSLSLKYYRITVLIR
jgi:hypothetical protein